MDGWMKSFTMRFSPIHTPLPRFLLLLLFGLFKYVQCETKPNELKVSIALIWTQQMEWMWTRPSMTLDVLSRPSILSLSYRIYTTIKPEFDQKLLIKDQLMSYFISDCVLRECAFSQLKMYWSDLGISFQRRKGRVTTRGENGRNAAIIPVDSPFIP